jgi:coproporphyrinogen III oxidase-like Fe-S oxidoreductase
MSQTTTIDHEKLQKWIHEHKEAEQIQEDLTKEGFDEATIDLYIKKNSKNVIMPEDKKSDLGF